MVESYIAVAVAGVAHFAIGALWYSVLFGKAWMAAMDIPEEKMKQLGEGATRGYIMTFIGTLVMSFVTAHIVTISQRFAPKLSDLAIGIHTGFWLWLGYIATFALTGVAYEGKSFKLYGINMGYQLVGLLVMATIIAVW